VDVTTPIRQPNVDISSKSSSVVATVGYRF
jgi:hypothetical protein